MQGFSLALTLLVLISPMPLGYNLGANGAVSNGSEETVGAAGLDAMASGGLDAGVPSFAKVSEVFQVCLVEPVETPPDGPKGAPAQLPGYAAIPQERG